MGNSSPPLHIQSTDITNTQPGEAELKLYDLSGRLVSKQEFVVDSGTNYHAINMNNLNLNPGIYIFSISTPDLCEVKKIVFSPQK